VDVYRESVPTSAGLHVVGSGAAVVVPLPSAIHSRLRRDPSAEAALLEEVATSADLGAAPVRRGVGAATPPPDDLATGWTPRGLPSAARDALGSGATAARMLALLTLVLAAAVSGLVLRLRQTGPARRRG
jgi:hypothetical protein